MEILHWYGYTLINRLQRFHDWTHDAAASPCSQMHDLIRLAKEAWEQQPSPHQTLVEHVGDMRDRQPGVRQPGRRRPTQIYHVNLLKKWNARDVLCSVSPKKATNETGLVKVPLGEQLDRNQDVFSSEPEHTDLVQHHIITEPGKKVKLRSYHILEARRDAVRTEVKTMLEAGVIEKSKWSRRVEEWCSPIVLVPKPDGTIRFCNDFMKLN